MRLSCILIWLVLSIACRPGGPPGGQRADESFDTRVARPTYVDAHPAVLFDEAHRNIHTSSGKYQPFARLIESDGYRVVPNRAPFSPAVLAPYQVLVIANALGPDDAPDAAAFSDAECDAVRDWVAAGGALLLITDHAPTGGAAAALAQRFGVEMTKGGTEDPVHHDPGSGDPSQLVFTREAGLVRDHAITRGRTPGEQISRVMTFTGQSLRGPATAATLLALADSALDRPATVRVERTGDDVRVITTYGDPRPATGGAQAIALELERGRVVVTGEAAMLTAQLSGRTGKPFGMNVPGIDNRQLALNIVHWLSRALP